ncbi:MAG: CPBP family intramembrane glutamic endopeptidase [Bacteroidota bacterium]
MSRFLQQAWMGRSGWSPYLMTLLSLIVGAFVVGSVGVVALVWLLSGSFPMESGAATPEALGLTDLQFFGVNMLPFVILLGVLAVCLPVFHRRPLRSIITPTEQIDWKRLGVGTAAWMGLMVATLGIEALVTTEELAITFEWKPFLYLLLLAGTLIPIQASVEELVMRGYLMQGAARALGSGWAAVLLSSALFGMLHWANPEVASFGAGLMMAYYMGFGAFMALVALADDRLELAMGIHIGNNLFGTVVVTFPESVLTTPALIRLESMAPTPGTLFTWGAVALVFAVLMGQRYNWTWRGLLKRLGPVGPPDDAPSEGPSTPSERIEAFQARHMDTAADDTPDAPRNQ